MSVKICYCTSGDSRKSGLVDDWMNKEKPPDGVTGIILFLKVVNDLIPDLVLKTILDISIY